MVKRTLNITGMSCEHCVMAVRKELAKIAEIIVHDVRIGSALIEYDTELVTETQIISSIEEAGYQIA